MLLTLAPTPKAGGEGQRLKLAAFVGLALLVSGSAIAGELEAPVITLSTIDWDAAAASLPDRGADTPAQAFTRLNAVTAKRFAGIDKSSVPVLLPFNIDAFRKDVADGKPEAATSDKYFGNFHPTKFFLPGPAGYDATFTISPDDAPAKTRYSKPIVVEITGAAFVYDLDGPDHQEVFPPSKESRGAVSRHEARFARGACALRLRALRRALRASRSSATTSGPSAAS